MPWNVAAGKRTAQDKNLFVPIRPSRGALVMKILIGVDFSEESLHAAGQGFALAEHLRARHKDESDVVEVFVAYIEGSGAWHPSLHEDSILDDPDNRRKIEVHTREFLQEHFSRLPGENLDYTLIIEEGRARQKLAEIAERLGADWLFVGRSGSGALVRMTLGSTSYTLANSPPCNLVKIGRAHAELQSRPHLVCRLLLEKKKQKQTQSRSVTHARITHTYTY